MVIFTSFEVKSAHGEMLRPSLCHQITCGKGTSCGPTPQPRCGAITPETPHGPSQPQLPSSDMSALLSRLFLKVTHIALCSRCPLLSGFFQLTWSFWDVPMSLKRSTAHLLLLGGPLLSLVLAATRKQLQLGLWQTAEVCWRGRSNIKTLQSQCLTRKRIPQCFKAKQRPFLLSLCSRKSCTKEAGSVPWKNLLQTVWA
jgi:hypothetical protein